MKTRLAVSLLALSFLFLSPASAQAALTSAQVEAVLGLISAFGADSATIAAVRATLTGSSVPSAGSLWFGAGVQPAETAITRNSENVPLTTLTLTNNSGASATIYTLTVRRDGTGSDSYFRTVELYGANGSVLASGDDLDTKHQVTLSPNLTLAHGQTVTLALGGDISNNVSSGKTLGLSVVAINASSPIEGTLPLSGALQRID